MLLNIEKLIYGGDGLARLPPDDQGRGKAAFLPFVLAGEKIDAVVTEEKPSFVRAQAQTIVESSAHRILALCPYFRLCGGCHYQHTSYSHQLEIKREILRENLRRIAKIELQCEIQVHPSPPWNYRNRSRLQVRTRPEFAMGYFKFGTHQLLPVEECPISSPLINRGIAALWQQGRLGKVVDGVCEVELFANADDTKLLVESLCAPEARRSAVRAWAEDLISIMPEISGVAVFREPQKGLRAPLATVGSGDLMYQTRNRAYRVTAGAFFQTNRFLIDRLSEIVTAGRSGNVAVDLYAGVGLFSTALACNFRHTFSVESSQTAFDDLQYNLPVNGKAIRTEAVQYLTGVGDKESLGPSRKGSARNQSRSEPALPQPIQSADLVVMDPPRGGLGEQVSAALGRANSPRLTYVSCDPATLARDLVPLQTAGYRVEQVHLIDLFPQTYHLESVVQLVR